MPFTPFHLGPVLLLGVLLYRWVDLPTLLVSSIIIDIRAALVVYGPLGPPAHGILTTFVGGTLIAILLTTVVSSLPDSINHWLGFGRLTDSVSRRAIFAGSVLGIYSHVILDSILYTDTRPLFPLAWNPFFVDGVKFIPVYAGCTLTGILGVITFAVKYWSKR
ncbi:hypothetical protein [Halostagnicola kamekurae]|uniref:LexA-binding, inner membrane-associated hydrolase n=1 Tax=Halostagnicola kamekurae TaxID=619731 RepID=A0A1I6UBD7_9EURY|nr:hypothetical protein [Halostagnicola kamekurae]SFS98786.1 hypothetical protein SAMN04488556_3716 [Halostagnicola kamekurae]